MVGGAGSDITSCSTDKQQSATMNSQSSASTSSGGSDGGSSSPESSPDCVRARIGANAGTKDVFSLENLFLLPPNDQVKELQTIIWDKETSRSDFIFYADRLIRIMVEEGLNHVPSSKCTVKTPTDEDYNGVRFSQTSCAVSIVRSGEAMERGLRDCCRSIRIGKILIRRDPDTKHAKVYYAKFPPNIDEGTILLLYPVLETGATVRAAIKVLKEHGVRESQIVFINLFASYDGTLSLLTSYPSITMLSSELNQSCPTFFGQKYFGSD